MNERDKIPSTVDEYLAKLPLKQREVLQELRQTIIGAAPMAEEVISYRIPTYKYKGPLVHFASFKDHCSLFGVDKSIIKKFSEQLKEFHTSGTTIHFTHDNPLPEKLVIDIVKTRIKQNESRKQ
jgi:uncharacterized protein YdhG (YjbR/CyaY superfamily)